MMVAMNKSPAKCRRLEIRQEKAMRLQARGNAPKLARMLVMATAEPSRMPEAPAEPTGSTMNFCPTSPRRAVADSSTNRFNQIEWREKKECDGVTIRARSRKRHGVSSQILSIKEDPREAATCG
jgi:hypothetical protein